MKIDRPSSLRVRSWMFAAATAVIILIAVYLRITDLNVRPFHSDEGVNYFFVSQLLTNGYYPYSHINYHGPLFFYLSSIAPAFYGWSETSLRAMSIAAGIATVVVGFVSTTPFGLWSALFTGALLACSSSLVFYARYAIHETLFIFLQLLLAATIWRYRTSPKALIWAGVCLGGLIATKETFAIPVLCILVGFAAVTRVEQRRPLRQLLRLFQTKPALCGQALFAAGVVIILTYSAFGSWSKGLRELLSALPQWIGRGTSTDTGHFKAFHYYLSDPIGRGEPTLLFIALISFITLGARLRKSEWTDQDKWLLMACVWGSSTLIVYSVIPYKTPWLVINISLPFLLAGGAALGVIARQHIFRALLLALALTGAALFTTKKWNFTVPYGAANPFSYVHTSPELLKLVDDINEYRVSHPNARVLIAVDNYWPLPFYLRHLGSDVMYPTTPDLMDQIDQYDIVVAEKDVQLSDPRYHFRHYQLNDAEETFVFIREK